MLSSSTQLQNRSFHVVERTRTSSKCQKMKYARAKRAKILFLIVKYANLWGSCCHRRRGCLSSLLFDVSWPFCFLCFTPSVSLRGFYRERMSPKFDVSCSFFGLNRQFKQPRRRRQQKPHKFAYLTMKNSIFARFARAFFIF